MKQFQSGEVKSCPKHEVESLQLPPSPNHLSQKSCYILDFSPAQQKRNAKLHLVNPLT